MTQGCASRPFCGGHFVQDSDSIRRRSRMTTLGMGFQQNSPIVSFVEPPQVPFVLSPLRKYDQMIIASASEDPQQQLSAADTFKIGLMSGAVAGLVVDIVLFPLDTIKTRLQSSSSLKINADLFKGMYKGIIPAAAVAAPAAAMFFGTYDYMKTVAGNLPIFQQGKNGHDQNNKNNTWVHMIAAASGDVTGSAVRVPFEIIKQRLQTGMYQGTVEAIKDIFQKQGIRGFFTGYRSLVIRELPFDLIQFPLYEFLKNTARNHKKNKTPDDALATWETMMVGSVAGGFSAAITTPMDVVKTRLMLQSTNTTPGFVPYKGIVDALKRIYLEEGPKALVSGIVPRVLWISLGGAIFFGGYETAKIYLTPKFLNKDKDKDKDKKN